MQNELTKKEQKVFTEIGDFIALNKYPPSVRELSALTGYSLKSVHGYIERLVEKGFVEHEKGKKRSLRIVGKPSQPIEQERERLIDVFANSGCAADADTFAELADYLLSNGAIVPPCRIGDKMYFILDDDIVDDGEFICECTVTEVGSRGFWTSGMDPAEDDMSDFTPWEDLGKTAFFSRSDAEKEYRKKCQ